ncbi:MAG TPA: methyltransferase domain-containing protein [Croceicoccus sp.]|nr:methyltransferase domain-containing protein [Croceicoccus sp.]
MNAHRHRIERAFAGADGYERHARVQREVAVALADRIAALDLPERPRVLEIGCGTGFLTRALVERGPAGDWLVTDIAPEMVTRCRAHVGDAPGRSFAVLDGEYGIDPDGGYDLVCSSLAMQWFDDHEGALARMVAALAPGGHCLFATLGSGSFAEWRAAHDAIGVRPGTPRFADADRLAGALPEHRVATAIEPVIERHDSAISFLRALRAIGAHTPAHGHRPLGPGAMRQVMAAFEAGGCAVTYEVVTGHYRKSS